MLAKSDIESSTIKLEGLIDALEELGYQHLLGSDPSDGDKTLALEKALSKVLRALHKARHDLETLSEMCN